jgi:hypothetical protein
MSVVELIMVTDLGVATEVRTPCFAKPTDDSVTRINPFGSLFLATPTFAQAQRVLSSMTVVVFRADSDDTTVQIRFQYT